MSNKRDRQNKAQEQEQKQILTQLVSNYRQAHKEAASKKNKQLSNEFIEQVLDEGIHGVYAMNMYINNELKGYLGVKIRYEDSTNKCIIVG